MSTATLQQTAQHFLVTLLEALRTLWHHVRTLWQRELHWLLLLLPLVLVLFGPVTWLSRYWFRPDHPLSFQPFIPFGALYLGWADRARIIEHYQAISEIWPITSNKRRGPIWLAVVGCLCMVVSYMMMLSPLAIWGFIFIVAGILLHLYGWLIFPVFLRPVLYLFAMTPLPGSMLAEWTSKLQNWCAQAAGLFLSYVNPATKVNGNFIFLGNYTAMVSGPCSGMGILFPVLALTLLLILQRKMKFMPALLLLVTAAAVSVIMNILRIIVMGLLGMRNPNWAESLHDANSWVFTAGAFYLTFAIANKMRPNVGRYVEEEDEDTATKESK